MQFFQPFKCLLISVFCLINSVQVFAQTPEFLRLLPNASQPETLELAVVRYVAERADGTVSVDLVSAMHIAEADYYAELNERFQTYDAVLYELVADTEALNDQAHAESSTASPSMISRLQIWLKNTLGLTFQLEEIDYSAANMVHADMTAREFSASMQDRGESVFTMFMDLWRSALQQSLRNTDSRPSDLDFLLALFSSNRQHELKVMAAQQFLELETFSAALGGKKGSTLLTERNKKALQVLRQQLQAGKKRLAIFYGAAHMPDFAARLQTEFDFSLNTTTWIEAWDLRTEKTSDVIVD